MLLEITPELKNSKPGELKSARYNLRLDALRGAFNIKLVCHIFWGCSLLTWETLYFQTSSLEARHFDRRSGKAVSRLLGLFSADLMFRKLNFCFYVPQGHSDVRRIDSVCSESGGRKRECRPSEGPIRRPCQCTVHVGELPLVSCYSTSSELC